MAVLFDDVRSAFRALTASPMFVVLAALCLGIGIGANVMVFTVVDGVLLEPPPFVDPGRLVVIGEVRRAAPTTELPASPADFLDWRASANGFAGMAAMREASFAVGLGASGERMDGALVTADYFSVLGIRPILGRSFRAGEDAGSGAPVVLLGERLWRQRFRADRRILGRTLSIDGTPRTVVGVLPSLLDPGVPRPIRSARLWVPLPTAAGAVSRDDRSLSVVARLAGGVSLESAAAELGNIAEESAAAHPENAGWSVRVRRFGDAVSEWTRSMIALATGAVALVLLIACANVANLMLASAARRQHEFAIRAAIGATPWRIARQLFGEGLLVSLLGALLGLVIARSGRDLLLQSAAAATGGPGFRLPIDTRVLLYTVGVTLIATLAFGLFPALEAARGSARARLGESGFGATTPRGRLRMRRGLVVGQVALALMLLFGASLLLRSFMNLVAVDGGVDTEDVTSIRVSVGDEPSSLDDVSRYVAGTLGALSALPGVEAAAAGNVLPLRGGGSRSKVSLPGDATPADAAPTITYAGVTPEFFGALGNPLLRGRGLDADAAAGSVAVINERLAQRLWPGQEVIGKTFRLEAEPDRGWLTVIGVSKNIANWDLSNRPLPTAYIEARTLDAFPSFFFVRTRTAAQRISAESITRAIESSGRSIERITVTPLDEIARNAFWRQELVGIVLSIFGLASLLLTAVGIYGVLAYLVGQRAREIGIRMALGAPPRGVLGMVVRQGVEFVGAGVMFGAAGAYLLARAMRGLLFGVDPLDPILLAGVTALLAVVAIAATVIPAIRAARIDPNALLRV